jgi:hypothetical protein
LAPRVPSSDNKVAGHIAKVGGYDGCSENTMTAESMNDHWPAFVIRHSFVCILPSAPGVVQAISWKSDEKQGMHRNDLRMPLN